MALSVAQVRPSPSMELLKKVLPDLDPEEYVEKDRVIMAGLPMDGVKMEPEDPNQEEARLMARRPAFCLLRSHLKGIPNVLI